MISIDLRRPRISDERVEFVQADIYDISTLLDDEFAATLIHPWLVIEDAHVNVAEVLTVLHRHLAPADYLIVEDSFSKRTELLDLVRRGHTYRLDSRYTDLFGENLTCAIDSILVRQPKME